MLAAAAAPVPLCLNSLMVNMFSPSKNPCMIRVPTVNGVSRYRNDPYRALVVPQIAPSPMKSIDANVIPPLSASKIANRMRMVAAAQATAHAMSNLVVPPAAVPIPVAEAAFPQSENVTAPVKDTRTHYCLIKFKHESMMFVAPFKIEVGDVVFTEGDRGQNIGTVSEITTEKPSFNVPMKLIRHADAKEREALAITRRKEAAATRVCQENADALGLPMKIVDCEYQADYAKLTIFFSAKTPVDFRKLQRCLFKEFRCRIWLVDW